MADSLRDQLLKSGIVKQVREEKRPQQAPKQPPKHGKPHGHAGKPPAQRRSQEEIDLAKAYAIRAQTEASERKRIEQEAAEQARLKRERKQKIQQLLEKQALNKPAAEAEQLRHFEYGGKIRRIYVDAAQLAALNAGELGVVQQGGHYVLVSRQIAEQVRAIDAHLLALLVEPGAGGIGDDGVPDDLMW
jgi:uncharacterized protein YaiL (DUF2058 family)